MNSTTSSAISPDFKTSIEKIGQQKGKLEVLTSLMGFRAVDNHRKAGERNRAAEDAAVRRAAWGDAGGDTVSEDDDMGHTILGDINYPAPVAYPPQKQSSVLPMLAMAALGATIPAAGIGGFLLHQYLKPDQPAAVAPGDDESVNLGLGRVEDYLSANQ